MTDPKLTPPPELVREWNQDAIGTHFEPYGYSEFIAARAAAWGADTELDACCEWLSNEVLCESNVHRFLRAARRPKPPSLKEQALAALDDAIMRGDCITTSDALPTIRRALEALPE
jgi:hypothetical protein